MCSGNSRSFPSFKQGLPPAQGRPVEGPQQKLSARRSPSLFRFQKLKHCDRLRGRPGERQVNSPGDGENGEHVGPKITHLLAQGLGQGPGHDWWATCAFSLRLSPPHHREQIKWILRKAGLLSVSLGRAVPPSHTHGLRGSATLHGGKDCWHSTHWAPICLNSALFFRQQSHPCRRSFTLHRGSPIPIQTAIHLIFTGHPPSLLFTPQGLPTPFLRSQDAEGPALPLSGALSPSGRSWGEGGHSLWSSHHVIQPVPCTPGCGLPVVL